MAFFAHPRKKQLAFADGLDTGDTAFVLLSAGLVLLMTPGLAFFYGGLVRAKNVVHTMNMSLVFSGSKSSRREDVNRLSN